MELWEEYGWYIALVIIACIVAPLIRRVRVNDEKKD